MYLTNQENGERSAGFNWDDYFSGITAGKLPEDCDCLNIVDRIRRHLAEDMNRMVFVLGKLMLALLRDLRIHQPEILELGAATGFLSRWLLGFYGGRAVLVDNCESSYKAFISRIPDPGFSISYRLVDIFTFESQRSFDIVCSFGLIEHFPRKKEIMEAHTRHMADSGLIIILVPLDTPLTRTFFEVHPELNTGYRELLTRRELADLLGEARLEVLGTETSHGYVYDYIGVVCRKKSGR